MHTRCLVLSVLALVSVACGPSAYPEPSAPSLMSSSSYSAPSMSGPSGPLIPNQQARGDIIVRPDLVCVPFVLRLEGTDSKVVLASLEKATLAVQDRYAKAIAGQAQATTKMLGVNVSNLSHDTEKTDQPQPGKFVVTVDGSVEVPLAADANYWARARLMTSLAQALRDTAPLVPPAAEGEPQMDSAFGSPEIKLRDPESFRAELVKRWVERTRAFTRAVESPTAPLNLVACEQPQAIGQTQISIEQIGLSLSVSCRIDVMRPAP